MTENEMAGPHHQINGHEFEQTPGLVMGREAWRAAISGVTGSDTTTERQSTKIAFILMASRQVLPPRGIPEASAAIVPRRENRDL